MKSNKFKDLKSQLSRDEMKNVLGGYSCGWSGNGTYGSMCGISQSDAMALQSTFGGYWCCQSCSSTSYCG